MFSDGKSQTVALSSEFSGPAEPNVVSPASFSKDIREVSMQNSASGEIKQSIPLQQSFTFNAQRS
jgi:hypothetical protein